VAPRGHILLAGRRGGGPDSLGRLRGVARRGYRGTGSGNEAPDDQPDLRGPDHRLASGRRRPPWRRRCPSLERVQAAPLRGRPPLAGEVPAGVVAREGPAVRRTGAELPGETLRAGEA